MVNELYWIFYYVIVIVMVEEMLINDDVIARWLLLQIDVMLRVSNIREGMVS